ncbi:predicted protein [Sclerotinia sclerotiorum 1980 UF-70]|uniref:Uncharacterized protein n=1 Tax=Sclerotinia sclerotiorum (strain ATCC 18683 / 1980 / Ss-1) TaxID=665079 RepID=A7FA63_SCLS1|nr:predicted protein [Sclerotinia sclerotiorum 1980 UF-70]EDO00624.1 predicted protein [Sclerotinia sclerotiorum 1980 UF-70]
MSHEFHLGVRDSTSRNNLYPSERPTRALIQREKRRNNRAACGGSQDCFGDDFMIFICTVKGILSHEAKM